MNERMINAGIVELCTESFGERSRRPLLMIMGATASMLGWPDELLERLATAGHFALRYDHRDTGQSTAYPPGVAPYSIDDLADDALAVMDAYGLQRSHVVGMSMGGLLAQVLALRNPDRILSVTLIASEIFGDPGFEPPSIIPEILEHFTAAATLDWNDEAAAADFLVALSRLCSSARRPFEAHRIAQSTLRTVRRARSLQSMFNHASLEGGTEWYGRTDQIQQPMLVIHGTDDPVVSYGHARALVEKAPDARLLTLEGAGHELHGSDWDAIVEAITRHTRDMGA